jgi:acyl dehydratase
VRFSKHVFPGETLRVVMWADPGSSTVVFQVLVAERGDAVAITNAAVVLRPGRLAAAAARGRM